MGQPFRGATSRNQPSNAKFLFGPSCWLRGLIKPRKGWAIVDLIRGIAVVIDDPIPSRANALHDAWAENWSCIARREGCDDEEALREIELAIDALRTDLVTHLQMLD